MAEAPAMVKTAMLDMARQPRHLPMLLVLQLRAKTMQHNTLNTMQQTDNKIHMLLMVDMLTTLRIVSCIGKELANYQTIIMPSNNKGRKHRVRRHLRHQRLHQLRRHRPLPVEVMATRTFLLRLVSE